MKNGNMPVSPNTVENIYNARNNSDSWERAALGLTLRQHFAGLALQGLSSGSGRYHSPEDMAHDAVKAADALLAELEKSQ